jgi:hypothetical protein
MAEEEQQQQETYALEEPINRSFGFMLLRHVNSQKTNRYWNTSVKLLRTLYPKRLIVIIDDNSNSDLVKADHAYKNIIVVRSDWPGRGELLPYIYFARNKWFERAVIIHDSVFFHKRIAFDTFEVPCIPIWHFGKSNKTTHLANNLRIAGALKYSDVVRKCLSNNPVWNGCFGVQSVIKHSFVVHLMDKYDCYNLVTVVKCREDRCSLERVFAVLFYLELRKVNFSLLGEKTDFSLTYEQYVQSLKKNALKDSVVKVFTGR